MSEYWRPKGKKKNGIAEEKLKKRKALNALYPSHTVYAIIHSWR